MARLIHPTPWSRTALAAHRDEITEGPELFVDIGYSRGWTCRLLAERGQSPLVEVFRQRSAIGAYRAALAMLPEIIEWRGCAVEVA